jgi:hypothetical protein
MLGFSKLALLASLISLIPAIIVDVFLSRQSVRMDGLVVMAKTWLWVLFLSLWWTSSLVLALWIKQRLLKF